MRGMGEVPAKPGEGRPRSNPGASGAPFRHAARATSPGFDRGGADRAHPINPDPLHNWTFGAIPRTLSPL